MGNGRSDAVWMRADWMRALGLAAIAVPLVLLVGAPAHAWHEEHASDSECAVCHPGQQTADLIGPAESASPKTPARIERAREVHRAVARRHLRQPARAPPA